MNFLTLSHTYFIKILNYTNLLLLELTSSEVEIHVNQALSTVVELQYNSVPAEGNLSVWFNFRFGGSHLEAFVTSSCLALCRVEWLLAGGTHEAGSPPHFFPYQTVTALQSCCIAWHSQHKIIIS